MEIVNEKTGEIIYASDSGSRVFTPIEWKYDEDLKIFVPVMGKELDMYAMIQLHKDSTDLSNIIARVKCGDVNALNVRQGVYGDFCDAPKSLNELAAFNARIDKSWNDLDPKVKELFGNSLETFTSSLMKNEIDKTIKKYYDEHKIENTDDNGGNQ